jgi:hypothetical protein
MRTEKHNLLDPIYRTGDLYETGLKVKLVESDVGNILLRGIEA